MKLKISPSRVPPHQVASSGFTLIELLIVIVILGLLMSLVAPTMFSKVSASQKKTAVAQMNMLGTALDAYRLDVGDYPPNLAELRQSSRNGWNGPYMPKDIPPDPWGNGYQYSPQGANGEPYRLRSLGKDGKEGGQGDDEDLVAR